MTSDGQAGHVPCRFCGRMPKPGQHRVSGPHGPICSDCIEIGLSVTGTRKPHDVDGGHLRRLGSKDSDVCEFCDRGVRLSFLGFRRPLSKARAAESGAVICADCLDWAGTLINRAIRG